MQIGPVTNPLQTTSLTPRQQAALPVQLSPDGQVPATTPETVKSVSGVKAEQSQDPAKTKREQPFSASDLADAIKQLNETVKLYKGDLQFTVDDDTQMQVVKVVDKSSNELIRQIPTPEVIRIAKAIDEFSSLLLSDKA